MNLETVPDEIPEVDGLVDPEENLNPEPVELPEDPVLCLDPEVPDKVEVEEN